MSNNNRQNRQAQGQAAAANVIAASANRNDVNATDTAVIEQPAIGQQPAGDIQPEGSEGTADQTTEPLDLGGDTITQTATSLIPFSRLHFGIAKSPRTFVDEKSGVSSRQMVHGAAFIGDTECHVKFIVGVRWKAGAKKVEPYLSFPTIGGRFNAGIDSDDSETAEALEMWKRDTRVAAMAWLTEKAKRNKTTTKAAGIVAPEKLMVDAADLGLDLG